MDWLSEGVGKAPALSLPSPGLLTGGVQDDSVTAFAADDFPAPSTGAMRPPLAGQMRSLVYR